MSIAFRCPNCPAEHSVNDRLAGQQVACPECGQPVIVPGTPTAQPVVVYTPPAPVIDYQPVPPRVERVYIREEVDFNYRHRGTFLSAFGETMGTGCGCIRWRERCLWVAVVCLMTAAVAGVGGSFLSPQPPCASSDTKPNEVIRNV